MNRGRGAAQSDRLFNTIAGHVARRIGPIEHVFCAPGPKAVHVDILHVPPTRARRCHTLVTCGMSRRPMPAPAAAPDCRWAELFLSLPPRWRVAPNRHHEERYIWPLRELGSLAYLPHVTESWLWWGHTIGGADPTERITPYAGFTGWIVGPHLSLGHDACTIAMPERDGDRQILIMGAQPIYPGEMEIVWRQGPEALFERLARARVTDLVEVGRRDVSVEVREMPPR